MKIRLIQPSQPDVHVEVAGDCLTVGRSPDCDVIVAQSHISKRHVQILRGLVAVDLQSSNGTFLGGNRLEPAGLVSGQRLRLGTDEVYLEIAEEVAAAAPTAPAETRMETEALQRRVDNLTFELEEVKRRGEALLAKAVTKREAEEKRNEDLRQRLESLKAELERQASDDSVSLQAKLAEDRLAQIKTRNEELEREIATLHTSAVEATAEEGMRGELEALRVLKKEQEARIRKLEEEPAAPASDLFFQLQGEIRALEEQVVALEAEDQELRRRLAEAPGQAGSGGETTARELAQARQQNDELARKVGRLTAELKSRPAAVPAEVTSPPPPTPIPAAVVASEGGTVALLRSIANSDVEGRSPLFSGPAEEFLTLESFRFLRQVEKIVTRMAGSFIQLYQLRTVLPDVEGTMRGLVEEILDSPAEREPREDLMQYIEELRKWLVVSLGAHRQAAERFAEQLKRDLGERSLTAETPIPAYKKLAGQGDAELWKRASAYLQNLTPDTIDDRLEKLAREAAQGILRSAPGEPHGGSRGEP